MAIRVLTPPTTTDPTPLERVAGRYRRRLARAVVATLERVRGSVTGVEAAIRAGGVPEPDWSQFWSLTKSEPNFEAVYLEAELAGAKFESTTLRLANAFSLVNPRAVQVAQQRAAELVVQISRESQTAVRSAVAHAMEGGTTVQGLATTVRQVVGLDERSAVAVVNYRLSLESVIRGDSPVSDAARGLADGRYSATSLDAAKVDRMVDAYSQRALAERASRISRTEVIRAANDGQRALWREAAENGLIDRDRTRMVWIATEDGRECPECAELDGTTVEFDGAWSHGEEVAEGPPAHPNCRCSVALEFDDE